MKKCASGAVFVETAMVIFLFLSMVASILMFAIATYRYELLVDSVSNAIKLVAVDAHTNVGSCTSIPNLIKTKAENYLLQTYNITSPEISFTGGIQRTTIDPADCRATISISASWAFTCPFCPMLNIPNSISIYQERDVEDAIFRRCGLCAGCS